MRHLALVACVALYVCFAQAQSVTPAPSTVAAPSAVAAPSDAATPAASSETEVAARPADATNAAEPAEQSASDGEAPKKYQPPPGYKAQIRVSDGKRVYCRVEAVIGTRFTKRVCYSEIELEQVRARNESEANDITRRSRVCGSSVACN